MQAGTLTRDLEANLVLKRSGTQTVLRVADDQRSKTRDNSEREDLVLRAKHRCTPGEMTDC